VNQTTRELLTTLRDCLNRGGTAITARLSPSGVLPKHRIGVPWHTWYLAYLSPLDRVIDLGCSFGVHAARAATRAASVVAVDRRPPTESARNLFACQLDLSDPLPFRSSQFDAALLLDVLEHIADGDRPRLLREIRRVLTPTGLLCVSAPNRETTWRRRLREAGRCSFSDDDHKIEYTAEELLAELRSGGFELVTPLMPVVFDTPWAGVMDLVGLVSLRLYRRLMTWKRNAALRCPQESNGFRVVVTASGPSLPSPPPPAP
jgi:SAM-dependent methyltransferase